MKRLCIAMLLVLAVVPAIQAQTFGKLWKQVDQAEKKSLPETVIKLTSEIYRKGERKKNTPQMLKAYMWRMHYRDMMSPDNFYANLQGLEQWLRTADKPMDRAILHLLIASVYADYAVDNSWSLPRQTEIVDETPSKDIREWTASTFVDKVRTHTREAMADSALLLKTSSRAYIPFVKLGVTSEYFHHDMYRLLASRAIDALNRIEGKGREGQVRQNIETIYKNMLSAYLRDNDKEGYVLTSLYHLNWHFKSSRAYNAIRDRVKSLGIEQDTYLDGLEKLEADYKSLDICAEVYLAKANYFLLKDERVIALQLCDEAIKRYPKYHRIAALKKMKEDIIAPSLDVSVAVTAFPGEEAKINVTHKNLDGFTIRLYQAEKLIKQQHYSLIRPKDYEKQHTAFTFKAPGVGSYVMRIVPDIRAEKEIEKKLEVTRFKVLTCSLPAEQYEVVALDRQTGYPIPNTKVTLYNNDEQLSQELTTDESGKVSFPWKSEYKYLKATKETDIAMPKRSVYGGSYGYHAEVDKASEELILLTDRSIYRPGQTVYVKGIAFTQKSDTAHVIANKEYTAILKGVNDQEVGQKTVRTNEFGSFTTDFTLPSTFPNGTLMLEVGKRAMRIRMEDYKRPTFDIVFEEQPGSYQLGDTIKVKGKIQSYSGMSTENLTLRYRVEGTAFNGWRFVSSEQFVYGEMKTNENGEFVIPVHLQKGANIKNYGNAYCRYRIEATATNVAGETQSSINVISVGNRSLIVRTELDKRTRKDEPVNLNIKVHNLNGQPVETEGVYRLYHAKDETTKQLEETPAITGTFASNKKQEFDWKNLPSGPYVLRLSVKDSQDKEVTVDVNTILFSVDDKRPPIETRLWLYEANSRFDAAHPAVFYFGTSAKDAYVMVNVFCGNKRLESKALNLSDTIVRFVYPYNESYGDGVSVNFCMVRDGKVDQEDVRLKKRLSDKTLAMKWDVFRDKLQPGQKEEWKLTIKTPQGIAADAEMLATMYDASLDKIWNRPPYFEIRYNQRIPYENWGDGYVTNNFFNYLWENKYLKVPEMEYDNFVIQPELKYSDSSVTPNGKQEIAASVRVRSNNMNDYRSRNALESAPSVVINEMFDMVNERSGDVEMKEESGGGILSKAPDGLRANLDETAFFYPQLRTNEQGEIAFSFTMPESLTSWNFRGYSHTKGMMLGTMDGETTTSKEFMLTPYLPRFVRVGDKTSIAASLSNKTGKPQVGVVTMSLFDPMTEKIISTEEHPYTVEAGKTIGVNFQFTVTDTYEILGCRLIADSGTFSDGEQQLLPVLSDKARLVETLPMSIRGNETRVFSLDSLFNHHSKTATDRSLTIEFTSNPAWYAIQALPSLSNPMSDNAISWVTAYYANTLASYIMNSQPCIKAVFDSWKLQGGTKETFLSNLQKNQDVKNILLSESPWLLEAQTEEQQKERTATLFDLNNIRSNNNHALTRLRELQNTNGSWSWYKGMSGNQYVTTYIVELNARLALLTGEKLSGGALTLQNKAFDILHQSALYEYMDMLKVREEGRKFTGVSGNILRYLYLVAISGERIPEANIAAYIYYLSKVKEMSPTVSIGTKAIVALILDKAGYKKEAREFVVSLKEHLAKTDQQGMSFVFNECPYSWGGMSLRTYVDVMEALDLIGGNNHIIEEMKLWLLKEKQTQQWNSPVATADAVYALLMKGTNLLENQGDVRIKIGKEVLEIAAPNETTVPGLGYIKRSFTQKNIIDTRTIKVEKKNPGIAWGAIYTQYESPISDVKRQGGELNMRKQLYVEKIVNDVRQLRPITEKTILQVGDKVVSRLSIRVDRPMDFVQLKDHRGACFEPIDDISGYNWNSGVGYYVDIKDASTNFFFDRLSKGAYIIEYSYRVSRMGTYETGLATMQCAYASEYATHSGGMAVTVDR